MRILFYSSPYTYYNENLEPLARYFTKLGHKVFSSFDLGSNELDSFTLNTAKYSADFLNKKLKVDTVVLTQCWWGTDQLIAKECNIRKIKFYIIEHGAPMVRYTQSNGKKSHLYRASSLNAHRYFSYGKAGVDIMKSVGYSGKNLPIGSSKIENMLNKIKTKKKGTVLFDTSNKMDDPKLVDKFLDFVKNNTEQNFIIREHSRSPNFYRKALKYPNVVLDKGLQEHELYEYENFIFSFPSSAMLVPALLNKSISTLYDNHFCLEARAYHIKYAKYIPKLGVLSNQKYHKFIIDNLHYNKDESATERIYKEIINSLGIK